MNNMHKTLMAALLVYALISIPALAQAQNSNRPEYVPGEILVKFHKDTGEKTRAASHSSRKANRIRKFRRSGIEHIKLPKGMSVEEAVRMYMADPAVEYAGPNRMRYAMAIPNDPLFLEQWALDQASDSDMDLPEAWDLTTGSSSIVIAVLDTGVDITQNDLTANIWTNPGEVCNNGIDDDSNGYVDDCNGWDFVDNDNSPFDYESHGTMVSGIIGAATNNVIGMAGIMWNVRIMPLRFMDATGGGPISDEIAAIEYAIDNGAVVLNASFGALGDDVLEKSVIHDYCTASGSWPGGIFVAAAGNGSSDNDLTPDYPASYDEPCVISVAATDQYDNLAWFSNYGSTSVHLAAPGVAIKTTIPMTATALTEDFEDFSGWSTGGTGTDTWGINSTGCRYTGNTCLQDSPGGNFMGNTNTWARSYAIDLSTGTNCSLSYLTKYNVGTDYFITEASSSDAGPWKIISNVTGSTGGSFIRNTTSVRDFDGRNLYVRYRLVTANDGFYQDGVYVENMQVRCNASGGVNTRYQSVNGTSFAAPHVSGIVGLVMAKDPSLTPTQVKERVIYSSDAINSLKHKTVSGGRANAMNALLPVPRGLLAVTAGSSSIMLAWTDTTGEQGYVIERLDPLGLSYSTIVTLLPDTTSYSDIGLDSLSTYSYRVKTASGSNRSAYATTATATTKQGSGSGPCFIATAAWGTPNAHEVQALRQFRDRVLMKTAPGRQVIALYNLISPPMATFIAERPAMRLAVRSALAPAVYLGLTHPASGLGLLSIAIIITTGVISRRRKKMKMSAHNKPMAIAKTGQGGFTLLEIIVVVVILGVLAAIVAPKFIGRTEDARITEAKVQMRNFETALQLYRVDNHTYPTTTQGLEALVNKPTVGTEAKNYRSGGYISKIPGDPWGTPYIYVSPGSHGDFDIISLGSDGMEGGDDYNADIKNWEL